MAGLFILNVRKLMEINFMKYLSALLFVALFSPSVFAGVTFNCEEVEPNSRFLCDLFVSGGTQITSASWSVSGSLSVDGVTSGGMTGAFSCLGQTGSGTIFVNYVTSTGAQGSASFPASCNPGGGNGNFCPFGGGNGNSAGDPGSDGCRRVTL